MMHQHKCPECYNSYPCDMDCTIEPDLEDAWGRQYGSYCKCDNCEKSLSEDLEPGKITVQWFKKEAQKKNPSPQWWKIYNGILK